jgi:hypothetical protein
LTIFLSDIALSSPTLYASGSISAYAHALSLRSPPLSLFPVIHILVSAVPLAAPLSSSLIFHIMYRMTSSCIFCHLSLLLQYYHPPLSRFKLKADYLKAVVLNLTHGK